MQLLPEVPMSPRLIKSDSSSSFESNTSVDIDEIVEELINDVCETVQITKKKNIYKYVKVKRQAIFYTLINMLYYFCSKYTSYKYKKCFTTKSVFCIIDQQMYKLKYSYITVRDNFFTLNYKLKIPYEYIKTLSCTEDCIYINLIPNEKCVHQIIIKKTDSQLYNKICSNMNYHVRYNKLSNNVIKYYQKNHKTPLEVY